MKQVAAMIAAGRSFYDQIQRFKLNEIELSIIIISATILLVILKLSIILNVLHLQLGQ